MSQARQMTIVLDAHLKMLEMGVAAQSPQAQIAYWRDIITRSGKMNGWFGPALAGRAKWKVAKLVAHGEYDVVNIRDLLSPTSSEVCPSEKADHDESPNKGDIKP